MTHSFTTDELLPDIIESQVRILFVSIAPRQSWVDSGHYHAGSGDQFYRLLYESCLVPEMLTSSADSTLPEYGIGLTTLSRTRVVESSAELRPMDFATGRLIRLAFEFEPEIICFEGTAPYRHFFDRQGEFGRQSDSIGPARVFAVPVSDSFQDTFEYRDVLHYYKSFARMVANPAKDGNER